MHLIDNFNLNRPQYEVTEPAIDSVGGFSKPFAINREKRRNVSKTVK